MAQSLLPEVPDITQEERDRILQMQNLTAPTVPAPTPAGAPALPPIGVKPPTPAEREQMNSPSLGLKNPEPPFGRTLGETTNALASKMPSPPAVTAAPGSPQWYQQQIGKNIFAEEQPRKPGVLGALEKPFQNFYHNALIQGLETNETKAAENALREAQTARMQEGTTKEQVAKQLVAAYNADPNSDETKRLHQLYLDLETKEAKEPIKEFKEYTVPGQDKPVLAREDAQGNLVQRDGTALPAGATLYQKPEKQPDLVKDPISDAIGGRPVKNPDGSFTFGGKKYPDETSANKAYGEAYEAKKRAEIAAGKPEPEPKGNMYSATVNGRQVAGTLAQMKALGVKTDDMEKVSTENQSKIENARILDQWISSTDPNDMGVIPIAQKLAKEGKLGPLMSKYQDFINRTGAVIGFDSGDPEFQQLMTGMGLEQTALMQVHVGSRGGAALLDHFHDLADAKSLTANAFLAALDYEAKYIRRKALLPGGGANQKAPAPF